VRKWYLEPSLLRPWPSMLPIWRASLPGSSSPRPPSRQWRGPLRCQDVESVRSALCYGLNMPGWTYLAASLTSPPWSSRIPAGLTSTVVAPRRSATPRSVSVAVIVGIARVTESVSVVAPVSHRASVAGPLAVSRAVAAATSGAPVIASVVIAVVRSVIASVGATLLEH
jgi:hypothetical protein